MPKERNKAVPAVYLILRKGDDVLLGRRANTGYHDGDYTVPSGHVEAGEFPIDALKRETREEIGVELKDEDIEFVHVLYRQQHDATGQRVDFFFEATKYSGEIKNAEPHKCDDLQWFPLDSLPTNTVPFVKEVISKVQRKEVYSELE